MWSTHADGAATGAPGVMAAKEKAVSVKTVIKDSKIRALLQAAAGRNKDKTNRTLFATQLVKEFCLNTLARAL